MRISIGFLLRTFLLVMCLPIAAAAQTDDILPQLPGRIAYIGTDGNVYSLNAAERLTQALTSDGNAATPYLWPTWSTDGRLAYFHTTAVDQQLNTDIYVSRDGEAGGEKVYSNDEAFTYAYWSPQSCPDDEECRELAVLLSNPQDGLFSVRVIHHHEDDSTQNIAGRGAPFYYSWSPDGLRMLWHRNNDRIDIYETSGSSERLAQTPGFFQAPAWSPIDDRWLIGVAADDRLTDLVIAGDGTTRTLAPGLEGPVAFSWSPDGNAVAYTNGNGSLNILDATTGDTVAQSPGSGVFAFFWSPDSSRIAYITLATAPNTFDTASLAIGSTYRIQEFPGLAWSVLDVVTGSNRRYGAFLPTREMVYLLVYFDQFSQSHRVWSPDSRYLVYSEMTSGNQQTVSVLDTDQADTVPFSIAEGVIGVWSFN